MRTTIAVALAVGACACCGLPSAQAADFQPQVAAPAPDYGPPPVAENYAYPPPPPPVAYGYPPPPPPYYVYDVPAYAVWPGPYGPYWPGYGPRFASGPWRGHWGRGWHR
jgi:hypothetical protein